MRSGGRADLSVPRLRRCADSSPARSSPPLNLLRFSAFGSLRPPLPLLRRLSLPSGQPASASHRLFVRAAVHAPCLRRFSFPSVSAELISGRFPSSPLCASNPSGGQGRSVRSPGPARLRFSALRSADSASAFPAAQKKALEAKKRSNVYFKFPETKEGCKTCLVLKVPKTESSIRDVYIPRSVAKALQELKQEQEKRKERLHGLYQDFDMVIAQPDGRPTEERLLAKDFKKMIQENDLPLVVFHSLRHLSTSLKLQYSEGDIKAVQGDTGHSQASMVTQVYSHTFDENRRRVADRMENSFFCAAGKTGQKRDEKSEQLLSLLTQSPELADMILALAGRLAPARVC